MRRPGHEARVERFEIDDGQLTVIDPSIPSWIWHT